MRAAYNTTSNHAFGLGSQKPWTSLDGPDVAAGGPAVASSLDGFGMGTRHAAGAQAAAGTLEDLAPEQLPVDWGIKRTITFRSTSRFAIHDRAQKTQPGARWRALQGVINGQVDGSGEDAAHCPFAVLFADKGIRGSSELCAVVSQSTRAVRGRMLAAGVPFTMPLEAEAGPGASGAAAGAAKAAAPSEAPSDMMDAELCDEAAKAAGFSAVMETEPCTVPLNSRVVEQRAEADDGSGAGGAARQWQTLVAQGGALSLEELTAWQQPVALPGFNYLMCDAD
ncbi:hypothetical protein GPECTOR_1g924 [Gonium pectorale]|uniref:Uncharacterized protein n=1 Tax=Gonium pectorale TaxID=33097 RepID=A0A150H4P0_GONPE|nr:hypothetical protein GPECTOR_1g924 [Gonium pectorale]|eukprot:KXZ57023.1 hypothetical protein GPECTOR_1g924 [Gonium pectorale]